MLNALYFKGLWTKPFEDNLVAEQFYTNQGPVLTQFMTLKHKFYFHDSTQLNALFLRLPYRGRKFSMIIVLPKDVNGIDTLIDQLDSTNIQRGLWYMDPVEVNIMLPKFKFDYTSQLKAPIESLGIQNIFTNDASLPAFALGAAVEDGLNVSNILQKAGISLDEESNTETEVKSRGKLADRLMRNDAKDFKADHPFLFFIEDETVGTLLFVGKVTNPISHSINSTWEQSVKKFVFKKHTEW
jgi:serine protease inhibitor